MKINILFFGQLTDITGTSNMTMEEVSDTNSLIIKLSQQFPALGKSTYIIAVDKHVISENTILSNNSIVALLPPFSGG